MWMRLCVCLKRPDHEESVENKEVVERCVKAGNRINLNAQCDNINHRVRTD